MNDPIPNPNPNTHTEQGEGQEAAARKINNDPSPVRSIITLAPIPTLIQNKNDPSPKPNTHTEQE